MENQNEESILDLNTGLNDNSKSYLLEIAKWSKFLAIMGFIFLGLIVIGMLFFWVATATSKYSAFDNGYTSLIIFVYLALAIIYFFPIYYLFKASNGIKYGIINDDELRLEEGLESLKSHYKFLGIFTIVIIAFYILMLLFGGLSALRYAF